MNKIDGNKRRFIKYGAMLTGVALVPWLSSCEKTYDIKGLSPTPDENGLLLPPNCRSRIIARSGETVKNSDYVWHSAPDGAGVLPVEDGGWIYLSNAEMSGKNGGVGAIRFNSDGDIVSAYPILTGSNRNCGGCITPWGTWLSCEEVSNGITWECDPMGIKKAIALPNLGVFNHESITIDPKSNALYLTEDTKKGCFYRFSPKVTDEGHVDLTQGLLEVAVINNIDKVEWKRIEDPMAIAKPTRKQVKESTKFNGGEGIAYHNGVIYFDTKGDDKIWKYDIQTSSISIFYNAADYAVPVLTGVDEITMYDDSLLICEDDGDMQVVAITPKNAHNKETSELDIKPILQLLDQDKSEVTGVALSPDKSRLYFSSQRGFSGQPGDGITYEITGKVL